MPISGDCVSWVVLVGGTLTSSAAGLHAGSLVQLTWSASGGVGTLESVVGWGSWARCWVLREQAPRRCWFVAFGVLRGWVLVSRPGRPGS